VGKYYTVSGKTPQTQGVKADIVVPSRFIHEDIGEEFLEYPLAADKISPAYQDTLPDIVPQSKGWFFRYYLPTIQHKKDSFQQMIPTLKKNSEWRIAHSKNYQFFLKQNGANTVNEEEPDDDLFIEEAHLKNFGSQDLSLDEAVNIVKDMVILETAFDYRFVGKKE
jgi:carboxyl-terminal processing protease